VSSPEKFTSQHVRLSVKRSKLYALVNLAAHGGALMALYSNELFSEPLKLFLGFAVFTSMVYVMSRYVLLMHPESVKEVTCFETRWKLRLNNEQEMTATLLDPIYASRSFIILLFRTPRPGILPVIIAADTVSEDVFRRTKVLIHQGSERLRPDNSSFGRVPKQADSG
jgi:hypothetical protein